MKMYYLYTNAKKWGNGDARAKNQGCVQEYKHRVRGNKQYKIITIKSNRVRI